MSAIEPTFIAADSRRIKRRRMENGGSMELAALTRRLESGFKRQKAWVSKDSKS